MKKIITLAFMLVTTCVFSQVGIGTTTPHSSAILDLTATDKAMVLPRVANTAAISSPINGMIIYDISTNSIKTYENGAWIASTIESPFATASNVTSNSPGTIATDDFVFGSTSLDNITGTTDDYRMFFDKSKGAFRAGWVNGTQWDVANVGNYSSAFGLFTKASGYASTVFGYSGVASGESSIAMGYNTVASGNQSSAMGYASTASGVAAAAMGYATHATGNQSTSTGGWTTASGQLSTAMGESTTAKSYGETAIGMNNTDYTLGTDGATTFNAADRLFVIGNGTASNATSDALVMLKNGNTTLKGTLKLTNGTSSYTLPNTDGTANQVLTTNGTGTASWITPSAPIASPFATTSNVTSNSPGTIATDDFVFGSTSLDNITGTTDDYRMFFDKSKGAFRAGWVNGTQWDVANVGNYSSAFGLWTKASGYASTVFGYSGVASGESSIAMGYNTVASGNQSSAMGYASTASGVAAAAMGYATHATGNQSTSTGGWTTASGQLSTAMGESTTAKSYGETAIGMNNTDYTLGTDGATTFNAADRLFVIGNGTASNATSDALVMLKNGNTTLKGTLKLTNGTSSYTLPNTDGTANQVLTTNGSGTASWSTPSATAYTGILPVANGGTGSSSQNFVDLTTAQTIEGAKTFSSNLTINATQFGRGAGSDADSRNIAIGNSSLSWNSSGVWNTAIGTYALQKNTGSGSNTAIGNEAISESTPGSNNTGIGSRALMYTAGTGNTSVGANALINSTTGNNNTAIGLNAFLTNTTGSNNTAIGASTDVSSLGLTNATAIGYGASVATSNTVQLGNTSVTNVKTSGTVTAGAVTYPNTDGITGQVLTTNGTGTASWITPVTSVVIKTANYTALTTDAIVLCNATAGGFTITLPSAASNLGKIYEIRKTDETSNVITISPSLKFSETTTINSMNIVTTKKVVSDGTNWVIIN